MVRKICVSLLSLAAVLGACAGAGSGGGTAPQTSTPPTAAPVVAGTEAPKQYDPGKTKDPSASAEDYYGY
jgi:hypothetical protein